MIDVVNLSHKYLKGNRPEPALDGLSFSVERGEIYGLLGPNGAGKTTAVKILTTILRPTSGRARIDGHDVIEEPLEVRRRITAVLQESAVETMLSVWDNLVLYGKLHGMKRLEIRRRCEEVIELLELRDTLSQRAQSLSGGFKRRLQVAKALMVDTPVLFLDEATTGMDPLIKRKTMEAIRGQVARGRTVVLTTQLLDEAESLCDRMALINRGRLMASGRLSELRRLSRKMFRITIGFETPPPNALDLLQRFRPRSVEPREGQVEMVVEGSEDELIRGIAQLAHDHPLNHFELRGASLEQIFLELYEGSTSWPEQAS